MNNLNYGIIGNCRSGALISEKGSIEWCCLPDFSSPSIFAKLLDVNKGGEFAILVDGNYRVKQKYLDYTNILITRFENGQDIFEVIDFMPRYKTEIGDFYTPPDIIRSVRLISGKPEFSVKYEPRLNYARDITRSAIEQDFIKSYANEGKYDSIYLYSSFSYEKILNREKITLTSDGYFVISYNQKIIKQSLKRIYLHYQRTKVYWLNWIDKIVELKDYYNDQIIRSALVLSLLTYEKTGAIIAALTTSLPEEIGGVRNWDYRFCWIRDASMMIRTLNRLGLAERAKNFLNFILDIMTEKADKMQIMYGIRGERKLKEYTLDHLAGYENSKPVRIGNAAYSQKQNDIYGVLLDVIYQNIDSFKVSQDESEDMWTIVRSVVRSVRNNWQDTDQGIWEIRGKGKHFTFSKVLSWVAVDRGIKIANFLGMHHYALSWAKLSETIKEDIFNKAWNEEKQAFTQYYGGDDLDASNLLMEFYGFIKASDPKYITTVKKTYDELSHNGLMFRYKNKDDFGLPSSSFTICNFWMVKSLYRIGEKQKAIELFDLTLSCSNHLNLFSEDIDFESKRLLGNFPQGYSHLALIDAAMVMSKGQTEQDIMKKSLEKE